MPARVGLGVVGAGSIGIRGVLAHLSQEDVQDRVFLAAVCDPAPGRAAAAARRFGVGAAYERYEDLLADPAVDAVTLCTPIGLHYAQGVQAIAAGKHLHVNKTMTVTRAEADELIARASLAGVHIVASPGMMLWPHNQRARRVVLEGRLGTLVWAAAGASGVAQYHLDEPVRQGDDPLSSIDPSWYFRRPGGGPQYDVTVYCLHNLTGILGPARRVTAMSGLVIPEREYRGQRILCDMDDSTVMLLDLGRAVFAFVYGTISGKVTEGFQPSLFGTAGAIVGTRWGDVDLTQPDDLMPHHHGIHAAMEERHVFEDVMQLVDWILFDRPSIASAEHARHVIEIIEAGYRAAETGQTQELVTSFEPLPLEALAELG